MFLAFKDLKLDAGILTIEEKIFRDEAYKSKRGNREDGRNRLGVEVTIKDGEIKGAGIPIWMGFSK